MVSVKESELQLVKNMFVYLIDNISYYSLCVAIDGKREIYIDDSSLTFKLKNINEF